MEIIELLKIGPKRDWETWPSYLLYSGICLVLGLGAVAALCLSIYILGRLAIEEPEAMLAIPAAGLALATLAHFGTSGR